MKSTRHGCVNGTRDRKQWKIESCKSPQSVFSVKSALRAFLNRFVYSLDNLLRL